MYNLRSEYVERHLLIISCAFIVVLLIGSVVSFYNYRIRLREMREARDPSKKLCVALMNDHLKEIKEENKRLGTSYESLIRKHKINAIALNEQIKELQEEVAKWKKQNILNVRKRIASVDTPEPEEESNSSTMVRFVTYDLPEDERTKFADRSQEPYSDDYNDLKNLLRIFDSESEHGDDNSTVKIDAEDIFGDTDDISLSGDDGEEMKRKSNSNSEQSSPKSLLSERTLLTPFSFFLVYF
uniref:Uncharacterized protein n=1 Tax=Glossina pallidipes TaxID=7398 RepID=A0A1A9ZQP7_GLOPL